MIGKRKRNQIETQIGFVSEIKKTKKIRFWRGRDKNGIGEIRVWKKEGSWKYL
jgi:hypothetical protein